MELNLEDGFVANNIKKQTNRKHVMEYSQMVLRSLANCFWIPLDPHLAHGLTDIATGLEACSGNAVGHKQCPMVSAALAVKIRSLHADLPILLAADELEQSAEQFESDRCTEVIAKPYNMKKLLRNLQRLGVRCRAEPPEKAAETD